MKNPRTHEAFSVSSTPFSSSRGERVTVHSCNALEDRIVPRIPGYRKLLYSCSPMGVNVRNVLTKCFFYLNVNQSIVDGHDVFVEILHSRGGEGASPIDPTWLSEFVKGTEFDGKVVSKPSVPGHSFFVGNADGTSPREIRIKSTLAYAFVERYGEALSVGIAFKDRVSGAEDAMHLRDLLSQVLVGFNALAIGKTPELELLSEANARGQMVEWHESQKKRAFENFRKGVETLSKYGFGGFYKDNPPIK